MDLFSHLAGFEMPGTHYCCRYSDVQEIAGEAALYVNPADPDNIGDQMMRMYKDESLRTSLIEKGKIEGPGIALINLQHIYGDAFA